MCSTAHFSPAHHGPDEGIPLLPLLTVSSCLPQIETAFLRRSRLPPLYFHLEGLQNESDVREAQEDAPLPHLIVPISTQWREEITHPDIFLYVLSFKYSHNFSSSSKWTTLWLVTSVWAALSWSLSALDQGKDSLKVGAWLWVAPEEEEEGS